MDILTICVIFFTAISAQSPEVFLFSYSDCKNYYIPNFAYVAEFLRNIRGIIVGDRE